MKELLPRLSRVVTIRGSWLLATKLKSLVVRVRAVVNQRDCMSSDRLPNRKPAVD